MKFYVCILKQKRGFIMCEMYQKMYDTLFNAITRALEDLARKDLPVAEWRLAEAQREAEKIFMDWDWENSEPEK